MAKTRDILNRLPHFLAAADTASALYWFVRTFGQILDRTETDLLEVMQAHFVDNANNEGSRGFDTTQKGDLDKIFSLYLENLGGTSQLKQVDRPIGQGTEDKAKASDDLYRRRIKGLIAVLKSGASTKEGIIAIIAANLGIVGDDQAAVVARNMITITEFLPAFQSEKYQAAIFEQFTIANPNPIESHAEIRIHIRSDFAVPLNNPRVVNLTTGKSVQYLGDVKLNDVLSFFPNGTAFLNGEVISIVGSTPALPVGRSDWRLEASLGVSMARFDHTLFDLCAFEQEQLSQVAVYDMEEHSYDHAVFAYPGPQEQIKQAAVFDRTGSGFDEGTFAFPSPYAEISIAYYKLRPASFQVNIPWDIPPYTDNLDKYGDRPREQIPYIIEKVKAAGVLAEIAYEKKLWEPHDLADSLTCSAQRQVLTEAHLAEEANFDIGSFHTPYPGGLVHEMSDTLITSGMFDHTCFDSLNTFS